MSETITFSPAPSVLGFGALNKLPDLLGSRGVKRLLIITDSHIAESGILERVLDMLKSNIAYELFTDVPAEFSTGDIDAQKEHFGSNFDALLGLGGGSSMDVDQHNDFPSQEMMADVSEEGPVVNRLTARSVRSLSQQAERRGSGGKKRVQPVLLNLSEKSSTCQSNHRFL